MAVKRKIIQIDDELCDGCGQCVPACAEGAIQIVDGKARLVADQYCDGLGACMGECPTGALQIIEREAEEFDEEAVAEYLQSAAAEEKAEDTGSMACGCPSSQIRTFQPAPGSGGQACTSEGASPSKLSHWPVQIRLVPPGAPFLKGADLLVAADCTPFAYPDFHRDFMSGRVVLVGCPKFDDIEDYAARFAQIFREADIRSVTAVVMEVPCCSGLPAILEKAVDQAGVHIPMEVIVLGTQGDILHKETRFPLARDEK